MIECFESMHRTLSTHLDFDESRLEERMVFQNGIDNDLDMMKRTYHGLDDFLGQVAIRIECPSNVHDWSVVYFPQIGFLVKIPLDSARNVQSIDPRFEFQFLAEEYGYFKSRDMRELDTEIGDIHSLIVDRELELLQV